MDKICNDCGAVLTYDDLLEGHDRGHVGTCVVCAAEHRALSPDAETEAYLRMLEENSESV